MTVTPVNIPYHLKGLFSVGGGLPYAQKKSRRKRNAQSAGILKHLYADFGFFAGAVPVRGNIRGRLQHKPHARVYLSETLKLVIVQNAGVGVRQNPHLKCLFTHVITVIEDCLIADLSDMLRKALLLLRSFAECEERLRAPRCDAESERVNDRVLIHHAAFMHGLAEYAVSAVIAAYVRERQEDIARIGYRIQTYPDLIPTYPNH